jgi:hypothetical protein
MHPVLGGRNVTTDGKKAFANCHQHLGRWGGDVVVVRRML